MGDEQVREIEAFLQLEEQVDDLGLDRDVEGAHRLVENHEVRFDGQRPGDADPLALTTRELVRVAVEKGRTEADRAQKLDDTGVAGLAPVPAATRPERAREGFLRGERAVERGPRVLEDHLGAAPEPSQSAPASGLDGASVKAHLARARRLEGDGAAGEGRLSAPALADEAQGLSALEAEGHLGHRVHGAGDAEEPGREGRVVDIALAHSGELDEGVQPRFPPSTPEWARGDTPRGAKTRAGATVAPPRRPPPRGRSAAGTGNRRAGRRDAAARRGSA